MIKFTEKQLETIYHSVRFSCDRCLELYAKSTTKESAKMYKRKWMEYKELKEKIASIL